jgi:hypothetical protein
MTRPPMATTLRTRSSPLHQRTDSTRSLIDNPSPLDPHAVVLDD